MLVIGWGTSIKIISIRNNQNRGANVTYNHLQLSILNKVDVVASFQTSYYISGIAPFGDSLVVLAYIPVEEDREKDFSSAAPSRQVFALSILNPDGVIWLIYFYSCMVFYVLSLCGLYINLEMHIIHHI